MSNWRKIEANSKALLPIVVFLILYLGSGIFYEYIQPIEGQMGFSVMSVVVAFGFALFVAFLQNPALTFEQKIKACAKGIGDENIVTMLFIFLLAGVFSGLAGEAGGVEATAHLMLNIIPSQFSIPGLFIIAAIISMSMGTSVGTITVLVPIAVAISNGTGLDKALCVATVVGGAMFGDNLSFISDTTIAATKTQGVHMQDKFFANLKIALPAAGMTIAILTFIAFSGQAVQLDHFDFNWALALPYFIVLILSLLGLNVFMVLSIGSLLFFVLGLFVGSLSMTTALTAMGDGVNNMFETMIVTLLVASLGALIDENGGFEAILQFIRAHFHGHRGGKLGIVVLTSLVDIAAANNTVAIVMAAPIAKTISEEYHIESKTVSSLLDASACVWQGIIPYGAQLLIAGGLSGLSTLSIITWLYYPFLLLIFVLLSILVER